jgi:hypothetical protein
MMKRAIFGLIYDYALYSPTDAEMGITGDMLGASTDLQTLGHRTAATRNKSFDERVDEIFTEADLLYDPLTLGEQIDLSEKIDNIFEKPICYDCPSELWCGDCPDSDRCSDTINCLDCEDKDGCQNELPAGFPTEDIEVSLEVTEEPLSDMINDAASFAAMNAPVTYPLPAEQLEDGSWLLPNPVVELDEVDPMYTQMDELRDEAYARDEAYEEERSNPHMLNGYSDRDLERAEWEEQANIDGEPEVIDHPAHYAEANIPSGIECWDWYELAMTEEEFIGHMKGNVLKYVFRSGRKDDGVQDLEKAGAYLKRWLSYLDGNRTVHLKGKKNDG